jgi:hypothetical protein
MFRLRRAPVLELETHLLIAGRLSYLQQPELDVVMRLAAEVGKMLEGLSKSLKTLPPNP